MPGELNPMHELLLRLAKVPPDERRAALERECGDDNELRRCAEAILRALGQSSREITQPGTDGASTVDTGGEASASAGPSGGSPVAEAGKSAGGSVAATTDYRRDAEAGTIIAGRYTLVQKIGEGGMGEVWSARQSAPVKRTVGLKLIKAGMDSRAILMRFEQERQALALMDHPNIARVLDGGLTPAGHPFFVMDLVQGLPLVKFCDQKKLTPRQRLELFVPICQAVQHAHQKGIVHRDLKPANILVAEVDGRPLPKVIDFGVAKAASGRLTEETLSTGFGAVVGTLEYMSPEQAGSGNVDVDTRADVYSLGVILYEVLTGLRPIDGRRLKQAAIAELMRVIQEEEPSRPSAKLSTEESLPSLAALRQTEPKSLLAMLKGELDWVVMKCLEKDRNRRYETASGLARDIERYLADEPVEARPPSAGYRFGKFVKRHRGPVAAVSLLLVVLAAGMAGTGWGLVRARQQERLARRAASEKETARAAEAARADGERRAKEEAQAARDNEARERGYAEAVAQFVREHLEGLTGLEGQSWSAGQEKVDPNRPLSLSEMIDGTAEKLEGRTDLSPRTEADLRWIVGMNYLGLGNYPRAVTFLERCVELRRTALGPRHLATLSAENGLARAYNMGGRLADAITLFEQVRLAMVEQLGANNPDTLATTGNLAGAYFYAGRTADAIGLLEEIRAAQQASLGAGHPATHATLNNLASAYLSVGRPQEAVGLLEQVRDARVSTWGADHPGTLISLNNLARAYQDVGRLPEAIELFEQVRAGQVNRVGSDHPDTLTTKNNLAAAYVTAGRLPDAIVLLEEVLASQSAVLPADHPDTLASLNNLAMTYVQADRLGEALPLFERAFAGVEKTEFRLESAAKIANNSITAHEQAGQFGRAETWRREWLEVVKESKGEESAAYAGELVGLGLNLLKQEKWDQAEEVLRESFTLRRQHEPADWRTFNTQSLFGGSLLGQKRFAEAEEHLVAGFEGMKEREAEIPESSQFRLLEARERLVELYTAWGKPEEAARWREGG